MGGGPCYIYTAACIVFRYVLILNLLFLFMLLPPTTNHLEPDSAILKSLGFLCCQLSGASHVPMNVGVVVSVLC